MSTLLLRLAAPLQSWGTESKFDIRRTGREPTKSGVIGLLASAMGRSRDAPVDDLCKLRFGVRVDQEGQILRDFQVVRGGNLPTPCVTNRYYLSDAVFLAGLESPDEEFLLELHNALLHPAFPLYLGRRSCPPAGPLSLGVRHMDLLNALHTEPWLVPLWRQEKYKRQKQTDACFLRIITDGTDNETDCMAVRDLPRSYDPAHRQYAYRAVKERDLVTMAEGFWTEHDPMEVLGE